MKKFLTSLLILFVALVIILVVAKNWIIEAAIEQGVSRVTGFKTTVESVKFDLPSTLEVKGLVIRNPEGFKDQVFANIPEIYASLVLGELIRGQRIHLPEVRLNVQEVRIEKNEKGVSNVELLSSMGGKTGQPGAQKPQPQTGEQKPPMPFLLEKLQLTIRKVSFQDRSGLMGAAPLPTKMEMDLNVQNEIITNISDAKALVNIIIAKVLNGATLGKLLNIDPQQLMTESLSGVVGTGKQLAGTMTTQAANVTKQAGVIAGEATSKIIDAQAAQKAEALLQSSGATAKNVLGNTTTAAKDQVTGLFGKMKSLKPGDEAAQKTAN